MEPYDCFMLKWLSHSLYPMAIFICVLFSKTNLLIKCLRCTILPDCIINRIFIDSGLINPGACQFDKHIHTLFTWPISIFWYFKSLTIQH